MVGGGGGGGDEREIWKSKYLKNEKSSLDKDKKNKFFHFLRTFCLSNMKK